MTASITSCHNIRPVSCEMTGTYRGRSRHRLPRREGARSAGRTGGAPQYVPADMYPPATVFLRKRSRCLFPPPTCHGIPAKSCQVSFTAVHLARKSRESVPGVTSCRPPATAVHLITGCWGFSVGHVAVFSMKRATISTPAAAEYMYLSENHDVSRMVQLRVSHVWTHLQ